MITGVENNAVRASLRTGVAGLYAITPDEPDSAVLADKVGKVLAGGVRCLQYRNKTAGRELRRSQAAMLRKLCREYGALFIINDHLDLAVETDADGLHIGSGDGNVIAARATLGTRRLLGVSCYDRLPAAFESAAAGADYVAFGSFYASSVKPGAVRAPLALLAEAKRKLSIPVIAIGGITAENAPRLIAAGADGIAVISALFGARDVYGAARQFCRFFGS